MPYWRVPMHDDRIDRWLEAGLRRYASAEPRPGLEGRLLAAIRAQENRPASWRRRWGLVLVVVAMVIVAVPLFVHRRVSKPVHVEVANSASPDRARTERKVALQKPVHRPSGGLRVRPAHPYL